MKRFSMLFATLAILCLLGAVGCAPQTASQEILFDIKVLVDGHPTPDVRVALHSMESMTGTPILVGVSNSRGVAGMMKMNGQAPAADTTEYRVSVESLGDWQLASQWSDPSKTPLVVTFPASESVVVEIPKRAIKRL